MQKLAWQANISKNYEVANNFGGLVTFEHPTVHA